MGYFVIKDETSKEELMMWLLGCQRLKEKECGAKYIIQRRKRKVKIILNGASDLFLFA